MNELGEDKKIGTTW